MSDETTLLPCPICGKKVSIARTENEVGERWWFITRGTCKTTRCNCRLFLESEKFTCDWNDGYSLECRAKLVEKWNTRVTHGTLTAEQVMGAFENHANMAFPRFVPDWQAIADELNARAERTCKVESKIFIEGEYVPCPYYEYEMECGGQYRWDDPEPPNYCPNCGARVIGG